MRDEVEREVEGRDRADDADRLPQCEGELPRAGLRRVHGHHLARELAGLDRGHRERRHRPRRLDLRRLRRLARLVGDLPGDLLVAAAQLGGDTDEDLGPFVGRQRLAHRGLGRIDGPSGLGGAAFATLPTTSPE